MTAAARGRTWMDEATALLGRVGATQGDAIEQASGWRTPGLAEAILSNFTFGPRDVMMVFSASGLSAVPVEIARGARRRGLRVIAVTSVAQSMSGPPDAAAGDRLLEEADLVIDLCITRASVVGADRSRDLFDDAYREHARRSPMPSPETADARHPTQEV